MAGHDFDDDFVADDLVALSEDEGEIEELDDSQSNGEAESSNATALKKRKRREKTKERKKRKIADTIEQIHTSIAMQSPHDLSKYLATVQAKSFKDLSSLELDDMCIPDSAIPDTTMWTGPRTLDELVPFIIKVLPSLHTRLSQKSKSSGAPTLLFLTVAALRVADVTRVLKDKRLRGEKGGEVAKLFAKHFKLAEHVSYLKRTKVGAAAGTPGRIGKLLCETDALNVSALSHIILDATFRDSKKRTLFDILECRDELFKTVLGCPAVLQGIKAGKIQVVLF